MAINLLAAVTGVRTHLLDATPRRALQPGGAPMLEAAE